MNHSFYHFALKFRGGPKSDGKAMFAEAMFEDHAFPKHEETFEPLSRYIEEKSDPVLSAAIFDELWMEYEELKRLG